MTPYQQGQGYRHGCASMQDLLGDTVPIGLQSLCGCVALRITCWLRRVTIGRFACPIRSRSVCGSEDHEFETRPGYHPAWPGLMYL